MRICPRTGQLVTFSPLQQFCPFVLGFPSQGAAPNFSRNIQSIKVEEGTQEARFYCHADGEPKPDIEWYKDGHLLEQDDRLKFETRNGESFLCINDVSLSDEAEYKALARNPSGTCTSLAELIVIEPSTKPELIQALSDVKVSVVDLLLEQVVLARPTMS